MIKKRLAIIVILVIASLSVAGCTTPNPTTPTVQTTTSPGNQATVPAATAPKSADLSAKLNDDFTGKNYTLVVPFTRAVNQYGNVVYAGVVQDGESKLVPYVHNFTIEETKNRNDTLMRFNAYIAQALSIGFKQSMNTSGEWIGRPSGSEAIPDIAYVHIAEPNESQRGYNISPDLRENNYTILSEYMTKV